MSDKCKECGHTESDHWPNTDPYRHLTTSCDFGLCSCKQFTPTDSQPASDLVEKAGDETCPLCQSGLKSSNDKRVWICPNKKCRLSNWYLPLTTFSDYRKILDSRDERRICKVMFKHYCSGIVPDERTEGGYKTGFADAFAVLNTEHAIIRKMADFANLHASQQNADLSAHLTAMEEALKAVRIYVDNPCCPPCEQCKPYYTDARSKIDAVLLEETK